MTDETQKPDLAAEAVAEFFATIETHPNVVNVKTAKAKMQALCDELLAHRRDKAIPIAHQTPQQLLDTISRQQGAAHAGLMVFLARLGNQVGQLTAVIESAMQPVKEAPANGEAKAEDAPAAEAQATA